MNVYINKHTGGYSGGLAVVSAQSTPEAQEYSPKNKIFNNLISSTMNDNIDYDALLSLAGADGFPSFIPMNV